MTLERQALLAKCEREALIGPWELTDWDDMEESELEFVRAARPKAVRDLLLDVERLEAEVEITQGYARSVRDGFDCDSDGHKHNTWCRVCGAEALLNGKHPYDMDLRPL